MNRHPDRPAELARRGFLAGAVATAAGIIAGCGSTPLRHRALTRRARAALAARQRAAVEQWTHWVWRPEGPLPAPAAPGQRLHVVFTPHPDDETLSMGVYIANAVQRGDRVIVVSLTDGKRTGVGKWIQTKLDGERSLFQQLFGKRVRELTREEIGTARVRELRAAAAALGVAAEDVFLAHLDDERTPDFGRVTEGEAYQVVRFFAARYPQATFVTMSYTAEKLGDHLSAGRALLTATHEGHVRSALFAVSRLWWSLPSPPQQPLRPVDTAARERVVRAARSYDVWNPTQGWYAIGWHSVIHQFVAFVADPVTRLHGPAAVDSVRAA